MHTTVCLNTIFPSQLLGDTWQAVVLCQAHGVRLLARPLAMKPSSAPSRASWYCDGPSTRTLRKKEEEGIIKKKKKEEEERNVCHATVSYWMCGWVSLHAGDPPVQQLTSSRKAQPTENTACVTFENGIPHTGVRGPSVVPTLSPRTATGSRSGNGPAFLGGFRGP